MRPVQPSSRLEGCCVPYAQQAMSSCGGVPQPVPSSTKRQLVRQFRASCGSSCRRVLRCQAAAAPSAVSNCSQASDEQGQRQASRNQQHAQKGIKFQGSSADASPAAWEWAGLTAWRQKGVDLGRGWGKNGATADVRAPGAEQWDSVPLASSLIECAAQVLNTASPEGKAALTHRAWLAYNQGLIPLDRSAAVPHFMLTPPAEAEAAASSQQLSPSQAGSQGPALAEVTGGSSDLSLQSQHSSQQQGTALPTRPARPERPTLVAPKQVPSYERGQSPLTSLSAHLLHNLDTVARFGRLMPPLFSEDFARVADDEGRHLGWCLQRLAELGHAYGDMPAHDMLWQGCQASSHDLGARLAIVPMSQEARGLDAGRRLVSRLVGSQDPRSAAIVARISDEERAHVAVGVAWFQRVCAASGRPTPDTFRAHLTALGPDLLKGPFAHELRKEVGLQRELYDVSMWPPEAAKEIVPPAKAAAARGQGHQVASHDPASTSSSSSYTSLCLSPQELCELQSRLAEMLSTEGAAAQPAWQ